MCGVESEAFVTCSGDAAEFVVFEMRGAASLVGAVRQVAGSVVAVAAFDGCLAVTRRYFAFAAFRQAVECGYLLFQTAYRVELVAAG